jgi:hypothetical protein
LRLARSEAERPGRRSLVVRLLPGDVAADRCEAVVEAAWQETPPEGLRAEATADATPPTHAALRVVARWRLVAAPGPTGMTLVSRHDEPRPAWQLEGEVEACKEGPLRQLGLVDHEDLAAGYHGEVDKDRRGRCVMLGPGVSLVPTGEILEIFQTSDVNLFHDAFRVVSGGSRYWIVPAILMRGGWPSPVHTYSAIAGAEESQALPDEVCVPSEPCWGSDEGGLGWRDP